MDRTLTFHLKKTINETGRRHGCNFLKAWYMFTPPSPHCISQRLSLKSHLIMINSSARRESYTSLQSVLHI